MVGICNHELPCRQSGCWFRGRIACLVEPGGPLVHVEDSGAAVEEEGELVNQAHHSLLAQLETLIQVTVLNRWIRDPNSEKKDS